MKKQWFLHFFENNVQKPLKKQWFLHFFTKNLEKTCCFWTPEKQNVKKPRENKLLFNTWMFHSFGPWLRDRYAADHKTETDDRQTDTQTATRIQKQTKNSFGPDDRNILNWMFCILWFFHFFELFCIFSFPSSVTV